jgi:hypothetical protein
MTGLRDLEIALPATEDWLSDLAAQHSELFACRA